MHKKFRIKDTGRYGKGVFAAADIAGGEVIHVLSGETLSIRMVVQRLNAGTENIDDPLQVGKRTYLDLDSLSRTFNHSCNPSGALRKRSELFALRDIPRGAEITYDYSLTIAPTEWKMACTCGARNCRMIVGDVLSIPKATLAEYRKAGAVQGYMRMLLDAVARDGHYRMPSYEVTSLQRLRRTSNLPT